MTSANRIMWPFGVNWREPYEVTHSFSTDIFTSRAGLETRRALRKTPRKALSHTALFREDVLRQFNRLMMTGHNMQIIFPEVTRQARLTAGIASNAVILPLIPLPWMMVGGEVVVGRGRSARVAEIEAIGPASITIVDPVGEFLTGERVYHGLTGRLSGSIDARRVTNTLAEGRIIFNVNPGSEIVSEDDPGHTYGDREIFRWLHNWSGGQDVSQEWPVDIVDFDAGVIAAHTSIDMPAQLRGSNILLRTAATAEELLAFFIRMRGRRGEFVRSSGEYDLVPVAPVDLGDNTLLVKGRELYNTFLDDPMHGDLAVRLNGEVIYRSIIAMAKVGANTLVTVNAPWPSEGLPSRISWLYTCRLEGDDLTLAWRTEQVAEATLTTRTLPFVTGVDYTAYRVTPAGENRVTPEGEERIVIYL